jgi:glycosyltransferase involved in cell wall biosynthesis
VPVRNRAKELEKCLAAILNNDPPPAEVIVVDDGSTDDSANIAERAGCRLFRIEHRGASHARNTGAREAKNDILVFVDSDVEIGSGDVGRLADSFSCESTCAAFSIIDADVVIPGALSSFYNLTHHYIFSRQTGETRKCYTSFFAVRRHIFFESGGFDDSWKNAVTDDVVLGWRLLYSDCLIMCRSDIRVRHHKSLTFPGFIRNRFLVGYEWFRAAVSYSRFIKGQSFSVSDMVVSLRMPVNVLSFMALLSSPFWGTYWFAAFIVLVLFFVLWNLDFLRFLAGKRGLIFATEGTVFLLIESLCFSAGLIAGIIVSPFVSRKHRA